MNRKIISIAAALMASVTSSGAVNAAGPGLIAVWQPGSGAQWWRTDMTFAQMKAQDADHFAQGLRIHSIAIHDGRFTAVWRPGSGAQWWRTGMTLDQMKAQDAEYFGEGLRIAALEVVNGRYTAVWRPGSGAQWWRAGMTLDQLKAQDADHFSAGLRLTALEIDGGRYTAVWRPGSGAQWWRAGMTGNQIGAQDAAYFQQGLRLKVLEESGGRYAAVWRPGAGAQWWSRGGCFVDIKTEDGVRFGSGMRLAFMELQDKAYSPYRYPWADGTTYNVGQGNSNPDGSHNDSQEFAFDFSLPAGTSIRAVRDGTVEWLQESQSSNFNPNQPVGGANQPYPGGDLQNWGNAVRLRHDGGFTSWYFHIAQNGVSVNVGDSVKQGDVIATSGNTGRSTGAHLHFQVQADSDNWGQSVPISFQDCQVPTGGDRVKSSNR